jgi:hypothetical protein
MSNISINNGMNSKVLKFQNSSHVRPNDNINIINNLDNDMPSGKPNLNDLSGINLLMNKNRVHESTNNKSYSPVNNRNNISPKQVSFGDGINDEEDEYDDYNDGEDVDNGGYIDNEGSNIDDEGGIDNNSIVEEEDEVDEEMSYEDIMREKQELLFKLDHLNKIGYQPTKRYTMASDLEDMRTEFSRLKHQRDTEKSVKFQRKMMMALCTGVEYVNNRFDPLNIKLDGWSESMMENIDDYDEVFEELHEKYQSKVQVAPEIRLLTMVGGSAFMFHLTNTLFKSSMPNMSDILKQNPDILNSLKNAAMNNVSNSMPNNDPVMNMMNDNRQSTGMGPMMDSMMGMRQQSQPQQQQQQQQSMPHMMPAAPQRFEKKMTGPSGVDDILNQLDNDRFETLSSASETEDFNINKNVEVMQQPRRRKKLFKPKQSSSSSRSINLDV